MGREPLSLHILMTCRPEKTAKSFCSSWLEVMLLLGLLKF